MNPQLILSGHAELRDIDKKTASEITKMLTVENPDYRDALNQGRSTWYIPKTLCLAQIVGGNPVLGGTAFFPREARHALRPVLDSLDIQINDKRIMCDEVDFGEPAIEERDYQRRAVRIVRRAGGGVVEAPCGAGKTNIALGIVARLRQPTLWITHTKDLLQQSMNRAFKLLPGLAEGDVGVISDGTVMLGRKIVFATVQTLSGMPEAQIGALADKFGLVVVDECHHVFQKPSYVTMYAKVLNSLPAYYRVGVTATARRSDELERTMFWLLGPVVYSIPLEQLKDQGYVIVPTVQKLVTGYEYEQPQGDMLNYNAMLSDMIWDEDRNRFVVDLLTRLPADAHVLVLTGRVDHAEFLYHALPASMSAAYIHGGVKASHRTDILKQVRHGDIHITFATYALAKEGLDLPILDTLVLATPVKDSTVIEQSVGRIMRAIEGKEALVYDIVDVKVGACRRQYRERKLVYKSLGCNIEEAMKK